MNFRSYAAGQDILKAIQNASSGKWQILHNRVYSGESEILKWRAALDIYAKDVMTSGDEYFITVFLYLFKNTKMYFYHVVVRGSKPVGFNFYKFIKKYGYAPIKESPFFNQESATMSTIASSDFPPTYYKNNPERLLSSRQDVAEFIRDAIKKWYMDGGGDNETRPDIPITPHAKTLVHTMAT